MVQASASRAEDPGFDSRWGRDFSGSSYTSDLHTGIPVATLPGVIGSVLGLVAPVSVYCDWVRWRVWSATSVSVWQHVKSSEQIRPWDRLACCWDVKQPTNNNNHISRSLVCHLLPGACWTETSTANNVFLWCRFERDVISLLRFWMAFTLTTYLENGSFFTEIFPSQWEMR